MLNVLLPDLNSQRHLANLTGWAILADANGGDFSDLAVHGRRLIGQADAVDVGHPVLVGHLVALGIDGVLTNAIHRVAPMIEVGDAFDEMPAGEARELIALLLDDEPRRAGLAAALAGELTFQQDGVDGFAAGGRPGRWAPVAARSAVPAEHPQRRRHDGAAHYPAAGCGRRRRAARRGCGPRC